MIFYTQDWDSIQQQNARTNSMSRGGSREPSAVTSAMEIFLYLPQTPLCPLTGEQAYGFSSLSDFFKVALIHSNEFKSLRFMSSLSSEKEKALTASNSLLNTIGISNHTRLDLHKPNQAAIDDFPVPDDCQKKYMMLLTVSEKFCN